MRQRQLTADDLVHELAVVLAGVDKMAEIEEKCGSKPWGDARVTIRSVLARVAEYRQGLAILEH